jgi:hypothetical protein
MHTADIFHVKHCAHYSNPSEISNWFQPHHQVIKTDHCQYLRWVTPPYTMYDRMKQRRQEIIIESNLFFKSLPTENT